MDGATSPSGARHPGTIVFDDKVEGKRKTSEAAAVPQSIAWAEGERGEWIAVTRIETTGTRDHREITKFGADGQFLETTVQRPRPDNRATPPDDIPTPNSL